MKFETITLDTAMNNMTAFIADTPERKLAYSRNRSLVILGEDLSGYPDQEILDSLVQIEGRMQLYIDQYQQVKSAITPGRVIASDLVAKTDDFFNTAVPLGLATIVQALKSEDAGNEELNKVIDALFSDRQYLCEQIEHMYSVIKNPEARCELVRMDYPAYDEVFYPVISQFGPAVDTPFALAMQGFLGVESGVLLHEVALVLDENFTPKVPGFTHEFFMYLVAHELAHLICYADDTASAFAGKMSASDFDVYSTESLTGDNPHNADSYAVLILNAVALLHRNGQIDLTRY